MDVILDYEPQPRQLALHRSTARQILYGGALMGGKSHALRWDAIALCLENPGLQAYLFRRTRQELKGTHINRIKAELPSSVGEYNRGDNAYDFCNGSRLWMCYCEHEADVEKYLSEEMHWIGLDEAVKFLPSQIAFLKTRNRLGGFKPATPEFLPRFVMATNPVGPAHNYLKGTFIDPAPPEHVFHDEKMRDPDNPDDKGWTTVYIPSKMSDNKFTDAGYKASLGDLDPDLAQAYMDGDWEVVAGAALHNLSRQKHMLRAFTPPRHWTRFMTIDWGTAKPFSVGWYAVSEGAVIKAHGHYPERWIPEGALIRYAEYYGSTGKPDEGLRLESPTVAKNILRMEEARNDVIDYRVGDSQMWAQTDGPSVQERMMRATKGKFVMRQSKKDRAAGYAEVIARLSGEWFDHNDGEIQAPMLYITENCVHWWRTMPVLWLDENDPEKGPADKQENHCYDETTYACRSRPYISTEETRWYDAVKEYLPSRNRDPYATA